MSTVNTYAVEGSGPFPADMMRYDEASFRDAVSEEAATVGNVDGLTVRVYLTTERDPYFLEFMSAKRWESFGWTMTEINGKYPAPTTLSAEQELQTLKNRLVQNWNEQSAMREQERELIAAITPHVATFKEGDILACSTKGKLWVVTKIHGRANAWRGGFEGANPVEAVYSGSPLKKDGTPGKAVGHLWYSGLRKATPEEIAAHTGAAA